MTFLLVATMVTGLVLLAIAALHDLAARTVPNALALALAAAGFVGQLLSGTALLALPTAFAVFVLAAFAWRYGLMGGGDVKLLGATALLMPPNLVPAMVMATALAGGLLALPYWLARHRLPNRRTPRPVHLLPRAWRAERWRLRRGGPMPYAVAIASGAVFVLAHGGLP